LKTKDGFALGTWVAHRRQSKKMGSLSQDKIDRLNDLDFIWDIPEYLFNRNLNHLKNYMREFGHSNIKYKYKTSDGSDLYKWWKRIKDKKKQGKLTQDQIEQFEALGVTWVKSK